jgi:hypothetical protein
VTCCSWHTNIIARIDREEKGSFMGAKNQNIEKMSRKNLMNTIQKMPALDAIKTRARDAVKDLMLETEQLDNAIFVRSLLRGRRIRVLVLFVVLLEESLHVAGHPKS